MTGRRRKRPLDFREVEIEGSSTLISKGSLHRGNNLLQVDQEASQRHRGICAGNVGQLAVEDHSDDIGLGDASLLGGGGKRNEAMCSARDQGLPE